MPTWTDPQTHLWAASELVTAPNMDTYISNNLSYLYGDNAWAVPTLAGAWVNAAGFNPAGYRLDGTHVELRGGLTPGGTGTVIFTLGAGYRPAASNTVLVPAGTGFPPPPCSLTIASSGTMTVFYSGAPSQIVLDGLRFSLIP